MVANLSATKGKNLQLWAKSRAAAVKAGVQPVYEPAAVEKIITPPWEWIPENVWNPETVNIHQWDYSQGKKIQLEPFQIRILKKVLTLDENGYFPYRTVIWSQPKKSGKTQIAGAVGAWFGSEIEAPNKVLTLANDQEQSAGRIFAAMLPTLHSLGSRVPTAASSKPEIRLDNGTRIQAIANNYAGAAGESYGLTLWSELWAYTTERSRRLFDELVPVPTRKNSIRWIETYAGFEDESDLLLSMFLRIFTDTTEQELQPKARRVPGLEDLPCYEVPGEGLFVFWDHELRMPWHRSDRGQLFIREQQADLRETTFIRLWENRWQPSEGQFIPPEWFKASLRLPNRRAVPMVLAADASQRNDTTSLVGIERVLVPILGKASERYRTAMVKVWNPGGKDIDLEETLAAEVESLYNAGLMFGPLWYDPFQMHQVAMNLRKKGIPCAEFPQGNERLLADSFLYKQYKQGKIDNYPDPDLAAHIQAAKAKEYDNEQMRIIKGTVSGSGKVDAAVAQSMAVWKASLRPAPKKKRKSTSSSMFG